MIQNISEIPEHDLLSTFEIANVVLVMCYVEKPRKISIFKQQGVRISRMCTTPCLEDAESFFNSCVRTLKDLYK